MPAAPSLEEREDGAARVPRSAPERSCIGCAEKGAPESMIRLVIAPSGEVAVDAAGGGFGRGAHVHPRAACIAQAASRGLLRVTKGRAATVSVAVKDEGEVSRSEPLPLSAETLSQAIRAAMSRRVVGLLKSAVQARKTRSGSAAATAAWQSGEAALLMVATDAAAAADLGAVREAIPAGAAVAWGTKKVLAAALFRNDSAEGIGVAAITDDRIAAALRDAVAKMLDSDGAMNVAAPRAGFRGKVKADRAGRASGRKLRRTLGKQAVVERSE